MKKVILFIIFIQKIIILNGMHENDLSDFNDINNVETSENYIKVNTIKVKSNLFKQPVVIPPSSSSLKPSIFGNLPNELVAHILSFIPSNALSLNYLIRHRGFEPINNTGEITPFCSILQSIYEAHIDHLIQKSQKNDRDYKNNKQLHLAQSMLIFDEMLLFMRTKKYKVYYCNEDDNQILELIFPSYADKRILDTMLQFSSQNNTEIFYEDIKNCLDCYLKNTHVQLNRLKAIQKDYRAISKLYIKSRLNILIEYSKHLANHPAANSYFDHPLYLFTLTWGFASIICCIISGGSIFFQAEDRLQWACLFPTGIILAITCLAGSRPFLLYGRNCMAVKKSADHLNRLLELFEEYQKNLSLALLEETVD
jgi:hypothetical protein